jgi:hypothetical protein
VSAQASRDLDALADEYTEYENGELGLRLFPAARESFTLLLSQPEMGSGRRLEKAKLKRVRWVPLGAAFQKLFIVYRRVEKALRSFEFCAGTLRRYGTIRTSKSLVGVG